MSQCAQPTDLPMARLETLSTISNPLISSQQLLAHQQRTKTTSDLDATVFYTSLLTQTAGFLLRLPQEVIATSIIILQRYLTAVLDTDWTDSVTHEETKTLRPDAFLTRASAASIYLSVKQSFYPLSPRSIINVYALLASLNNTIDDFPNLNAFPPPQDAPDPRSYYVSEGTYQARRDKLFATEKQILVALAFDTKVVLPYTFALTYLQVLSPTAPTSPVPPLPERVLSHLNAALLSPQLLYLTHQPHTLAVAAIYLAARETGVALVDDQVPWWEVFDVGREELGFLVLSLASLENFVADQRDHLGKS